MLRRSCSGNSFRRVCRRLTGSMKSAPWMRCVYRYPLGTIYKIKRVRVAVYAITAVSEKNMTTPKGVRPHMDKNHNFILWNMYISQYYDRGTGIGAVQFHPHVPVSVH